MENRQTDDKNNRGGLKRVGGLIDQKAAEII